MADNEYFAVCTFFYYYCFLEGGWLLGRDGEIEGDWLQAETFEINFMSRGRHTTYNTLTDIATTVNIY